MIYRYYTELAILVIHKANLSISIFFPCFNDETSIVPLVHDAFAILPSLAEEYEVIVIDDGSTDKSRTKLTALQKKYPKLKLFFHEKNMGYGSALRTGLKNSRYKYVFYTDGDGQYDVKELPTLVALLSPDVDFINGIKLVRNDATYRILIGNFYSFFTRWMFHLPITDVDCDFRLIRKSLLNKVHLKSTSGSICVELVKKSQKAGARFKEVSVHHYERKYGNSQFFRPKRIGKTIYELTYLWYNVMIRNAW